MNVVYVLLVRRSITDPSDLAFYAVFGLAAVTLSEVVRLAGWSGPEKVESQKRRYTDTGSTP